jgi:SepF-like predicted cell division protein (DUF552 family)
MVFDSIKKGLSRMSGADEEYNEDYVEIDVGSEAKENKVLVKLFVLKHYDDINGILNALRQGYTIAVIDIKNLRQKDSIELKRAISKIKKTIDALEGSIAGFGENIVIATPSFAKINKDIPPEPKPEERKFDV